MNRTKGRLQFVSGEHGVMKISQNALGKYV
jgi:hypothetical protein